MNRIVKHFILYIILLFSVYSIIFILQYAFYYMFCILCVVYYVLHIDTRLITMMSRPNCFEVVFLLLLSCVVDIIIPGQMSP